MEAELYEEPEDNGIEVTQAMIDAGIECSLHYEQEYLGSAECIAAIYRAMVRAAPLVCVFGDPALRVPIDEAAKALAHAEDGRPLIDTRAERNFWQGESVGEFLRTIPNTETLYMAKKRKGGRGC